jgi:hypothetical protein
MRCASVARKQFASIPTIHNAVEFAGYRGVGVVGGSRQKSEAWRVLHVEWTLKGISAALHTQQDFSRGWFAGGLEGCC